MSQNSEILNNNTKNKSIRKRLKRSVQKTCSLKTIKQRLPIISWLPKYSFSYLIQDIIAGITVGLTAIPQGIAYAIIAGLPPEYGLYASLTCGFVYIVFGSCKDVTVGPTAILASMISRYVSYSIDFAMLSTFLCGLVILLMGVFKLGFLVNFISLPVISGFTTAAALQIAAAQLKSFFGLAGTSGDTFGESVYNFVLNIKTAKLWDPLLTVTTIIMLILLKMLGNGCNRTDGFVKKTRWFISLSRNAIVVAFGMVLAYIIKVTTDTEPFALVGEIAGGLPPFKLPPFSTVVGNQTYNFIDMLQVLGPQFIAVPLVALLETIAISKAFAEGGRIDATQEMIAIGLCNLIGAVGQSMPITGSFTRTALNYASGVKTQAGGVTKCLLLIMCLSLLTSTFYFIPKPSLAGLIMVAMFSMINYEIYFRLWRKSKLEFLVLSLTTIVSLFAGLEYGIMAGILLEALTLLYSASVPKFDIELSVTDNGDRIIIILSDSLPYCAAERITKVIIQASFSHSNFKSAIIVVDGERLKNMDFTVASNLMILVQDLDKQNRDIVFLNFNSKHRDLCLEIYPKAHQKFVTASKTSDLTDMILKGT